MPFDISLLVFLILNEITPIEKQVIDKNLKYIKNDSLKDYASYFIQNMMNISKSYQATFVPAQSRIELSLPKKENITVGFQGVNGSFSEAALEQYFGKDTNRKNYENFEDVFRALKNKEIDYGIVPLENSSTGAINDNYDLIRNYDFYIVGEQSISIAQHLLGMKGSKIEELREEVNNDIKDDMVAAIQIKDKLEKNHIKTANSNFITK